ncbi:MAG TPA: hypothetical protein VIX91_26135 [Candidatus Acidoferrum sp.]
MNRQLVVFILVLGMGCAAHAQEAASESQTADRNVAADFSTVPSTNAALLQPLPALALSPAPSFGSPAAAASPFGTAAPDPSPAPAPNPKFLYGGRDDFRWQLAIGADWLRFRNSIFNASAVGVKSSVTYFTNEWFGIEGNVSATFAPQIFEREHVKVLVYGVGPKIAWREKKWEPWAHAIIGGSHEQAQTAGNSKNAFAVQVGGGADYRINPRLSGRLEADWVHTNYFSQTQNNFELMGGVVFHF